MTLTSAAAASNKPNVGERLTVGLPEIIEPRLIRPLQTIIRGDIVLQGGEYDIDNDGVPDIQAYFRMCGNDPKRKRPYFSYTLKEVNL